MSDNKYKRVYIKGSAKTKTFDNGGHIINLSVKKDDIMNLPRSKSKNGDEYIAFQLSSKVEADDFGNTYAIQASILEGSEAESQSSSEESSSAGW